MECRRATGWQQQPRGQLRPRAEELQGGALGLGWADSTPSKRGTRSAPSSGRAESAEHGGGALSLVAQYRAGAFTLAAGKAAAPSLLHEPRLLLECLPSAPQLCSES